MNTTIIRIAAAAPVAVALLGFSIGSAHAAPYDPASADKVQIQPADESPEWDVDFPISDDLPDGDPPVDPDDVGPAEPADEPEDEDGTDEESDEESDEDADNESAGSDNGGSSTAGSSTGGSSGAGKDGDQNEASDEAEQAPVEAAGVQVTPVNAAGVQVPPELVASAGVALAGVVGWAAYRRTKAIATA